MTNYDPNQYPSQGTPDPQYQQGQYPQAQGYGQPMFMAPQNTQKNSLGVWSLCLGIASILCCSIVTGIPAAIVGYLGLQAANQGLANNKGMSIAGIILGGLSIVSMIILFATGYYASFFEGLSAGAR